MSLPSHGDSVGGPAFPNGPDNESGWCAEYGMSLRDYFAGQALTNAAICTGVAMEYELRAWFGEQCGITRYQILAKQALEYADALLIARNT